VGNWLRVGLRQSRMGAARPRSGAVVGVSLLLPLLLSALGCAPSEPRFAGVPEGRSGPGLEAVQAEQLADGRLAVTLFGSGSCPHLAKRVRVLASDSVLVLAPMMARQACTLDIKPTRSVIGLPVDRLQLDDGLLVRVRTDPGTRFAHTSRPFVVR
jgi:hypothetical protein